MWAAPSRASSPRCRAIPPSTSSGTASAPRRADALEAGTRSSRHAARIHRSGWVDDRSTLIAGALVLAYPSLYEGFARPPLEAMSLAVPVVATTGRRRLITACTGRARPFSWERAGRHMAELYRTVARDRD
ncbi:MAG: glycosyltransferase [Acidimicrobiales bacterium]